MGHSSCSAVAEKMPMSSQLSSEPPSPLVFELTFLRSDLFLLELVLSSMDFALALPRFSTLSDLVRWDDVLLLDKLLWLFPEERALSLVRDVPEDSLESHSNRSFVPELSEFSSSDSS
ncbi:hypothetical protein Tco_0722772 [Tanacetum coccineum]